MNWRKNESSEDILTRLNGPDRIMVRPFSGRLIDTSDPIYVEAVAQAREFGLLYEGLDMAKARAKARAESMAGFWETA